LTVNIKGLIRGAVTQTPQRREEMRTPEKHRTDYAAHEELPWVTYTIDVDGEILREERFSNWDDCRAYLKTLAPDGLGRHMSCSAYLMLHS
jgi:hypothetical protein